MKKLINKIRENLYNDKTIRVKFTGPVELKIKIEKYLDMDYLTKDFK